MSAISRLPFELLNLSKDLNVSSAPCSGWPPPSTLLSRQIKGNDIFTTTDIKSSGSTPLFIDQSQPHHRKRSTGDSYFEKLRSVAEHRRNDDVKSHLTTTNDSIFLGNLIEFIRSFNTWNFDDIRKNKLLCVQSYV